MPSKTAEPRVPAVLADAPPSQKLVYHYLACLDEATIEELVVRTGLAKSTVWEALGAISNHGLVEEHDGVEDGPRVSRYCLDPDGPHEP